MKGIRESRRREHLLVCKEATSGKDRDVFSRRGRGARSAIPGRPGAGGDGGEGKESNPKDFGKEKKAASVFCHLETALEALRKDRIGGRRMSHTLAKIMSLPTYKAGKINTIVQFRDSSH